VKRAKILILLAVLPTLAAAGPQLFRFVTLPLDVTEKFFVIAAEISGYKLPKDRPQVRMVEPAYFAGSCRKEDGPGCIVYGEYDIDPSAPDIIYLNAVTPPALRAPTLVHEIVHWLQEKAGRQGKTCLENAAIEREAYLVDHIYSTDHTPYKVPLETPPLYCE
jgi:hypothetical protein